MKQGTKKELSYILDTIKEDNKEDVLLKKIHRYDDNTYILYFH